MLLYCDANWLRCLIVFGVITLMCLVALPVTFGPGLPAPIGRVTCHEIWPRLAQQSDVIDFAY